MSVEEIRDSIGADSLGFISLDGLTAATTLPAASLCRACFDGDYPIPVAEAEQGKHLLEGAAAGQDGTVSRVQRRWSATPARAWTSTRATARWR